MQRAHSHERTSGPTCRREVGERITSLSDDALLQGLHVLVNSHRRATSALIEHLGEMDARRLHVEKGFSSLFAYCVEELRFSEDEACRRIEAARLARRFPAVLALLETGAISLTVLALLKPHLNDGNHVELLAGVSSASVRQAKEWIATRFPQHDVPSAIRKQPILPPLLATAEIRGGVAAPVPTMGLSTVSTPEANLSASTRVPDGAGPGLDTAPIARARTRVEPLSSDRFLVKFTASRALRDKLEFARDLMRHANPINELSVVLERAVDLLIAELQKKTQGRTPRPKAKPRPAGEGSRSEPRGPHEAPNKTKDSHVTRSVRREVVARDGWRCSFVADDGRRCDARAFLEFDHEIPKGRGGGSHSGNIRLLCRAHNRLEAERVYGKAHIVHAIFEARQGGDGNPATP